MRPNTDIGRCSEDGPINYLNSIAWIFMNLIKFNQSLTRHFACEDEIYRKDINRLGEISQSATNLCIVNVDESSVAKLDQ